MACSSVTGIARRRAEYEHARNDFAESQLAEIHNCSLDTFHSANNLGFIFDEHLTFSDQITGLSLSNACYYHIRHFAVPAPYVDSDDSSTACTTATAIVHYKLITAILSTINSRSLNYPVSSRSRTLLLIFVKAPKSSHITGSGSLNASNTNSSHLPTKFSQLPNPTFITSSPFNVLAVLAIHLSLLLLGHTHYPL